MTYTQTLNWLFEKLPMYQRVGKAAYKSDLTNTIALCNILDNPQDKLKFIHVAGTNGKGSVCHIIASVLQESGYKTGLYTSPHLLDFRERIRVNGKMVSKEFVVDFVDKYQNQFTINNLSFFEMTCGLAFEYFYQSNVDVVVLETGMGGRLDSTNIVHPEISVITNISSDHQAFLGKTLEEIAVEKAGIIKPFTPVIIGRKQTNIAHVFTEISDKLGAPLFFAESYNINKKPDCDLDACYEKENTQTAFAVCTELIKKGYHITEDSLRLGFANVRINTHILGRWQQIDTIPLTICDVGHNVDGIKQVIKQINQTTYQNLHFVFGMVNDKDCEKILSLLPKRCTYYFCKPNIPRGMPTMTLFNTAREIGLNGKVFSTVKVALMQARKNANVEDLVVVGGSFFVVAEVL